MSQKISVTLTVNGRRHTVSALPDTPLLWVLREVLKLTGTRYGCGVGQCGACTVLLNGTPTRACLTNVSTVGTRQVTTIEGLPADASHPLQRAWLELDVPQCGYCQAGMIMAVAALLREKPKPTDADIDASITNICRCGTFQEVRKAIHAAARASAKPSA